MEATVNVSGYQLTAQLYAGKRTLVYRGIRDRDNSPVAIKVLRNEYPSFNEIVQFRNQYTIAHHLDFSGVIKTFAIEPYGKSYALVMEDFGGISLSDYLLPRTHNGKSQNYLGIDEFLEIALQLTDSLDYLYRNRIIHKDIKPGNILINPETQQVKLIDFSISSFLPRETQAIQNPNVLEGTLAYLSPEQTGRMNRGIDYRSDFYTLGVTFYELLTGRLPFDSEDAMKLVHDHLAKAPVAIHQINPNIPRPLSEIVSKLMAKNAENRYQSALGLKHDLEICFQQWKSTGTIEPFALAQRDIADCFIIPEKLYGRTAEVEQLLESFERVSAGGAEIMLVAGSSGIGKTALVNEVHKPIVRDRGYFIKGKYDPFQRNIPFSGFVQAFRDLIEQILSEPESELATWKSEILATVGENGQVLIEVIPELEKIIGPQQPASEVTGTATQNRFNLLFQKFLQLFTRRERPLVIFLDDLQWVDTASLSLVQTLMQDVGYLLIIAAYRDNEVSPTHPLALMQAKLKENKTAIAQINLRPLTEIELNELVADTLKYEQNEAKTITASIYQKTQGNPFFATQFLKSLYEEAAIAFDSVTRSWQCDAARIEALTNATDVVGFMALQLQKLPPETQNALKFAACIGAEFDLKLLAIVLEKSPTQTALTLWQGLQAGTIVPTTTVYPFFSQLDETEAADAAANPTYKFLHDSVQQAAYSLIPEGQRIATHLRIGRLLLHNSSAAEIEENLFEIVGHLNSALALLQHPSERQYLAELNWKAGQKARQSTAYSAARIYLHTGIHLLEVDCWQTQYQLALNLYLAAAEAAHLEGDFEEMERLVVPVLEQAKTVLDKLPIYKIKIAALTSQRQSAEAVALARNVLVELGVELPTDTDEKTLQKTQKKLSILLGNRSIEELIDLPLMEAPEQRAAMELLGILFVPVLLSIPTFLPLLCATMVSLSLQFGNAPASAIGYVGYSLVLCAFLGDVETGYRFGRLAVHFLEKSEEPKFKSSVLAIYSCFVQHYRESLREAIETNREGYEAGLETGDLFYAGYNVCQYLACLFFSGRELEFVAREIENYRPIVVKNKQDALLTNIDMLQQMAINFQEVASQPDCLIGSICDEREILAKVEGDSEFSSRVFTYTYKLLLACFFDCAANALDYIDRIQPYLVSVSGTFYIPIFNFYAALTNLRRADLQPLPEVKKILERVESYQSELGKWAQHAPMNYLNKWHLVEAERCRVLGNKAEAIENYDRAIQLARENQFLPEEALANERAAKFCLQWGKERVAASYAIEAYYSYSAWGARAKIIDLEEKYPELLQVILQSNRNSVSGETTVSSITPTQSRANKSSNTNNDFLLDFPTVVRAIQALSQEIKFDSSIEKLMQLVIANAGAQRGCLILHQDEQWRVVARANPEGVELLEVPLEQYRELPQRLIYGVARNGEIAVFDDLSAESKFAGDRYITTACPKSALGLPISRQSKMVGILYLENNVTVAAFTYKQVEILKLLATQAAISIENARLYQEIERHSQSLEVEVAQKTQHLNQKASDLEQALSSLRETQSQLIQSEKMSSLGQLVAGIAHEINNPVNFIQGNLVHANKYMTDLLSLLDLYQAFNPVTNEEIEAKIEEIDLEFIREDAPSIFQSMNSGSERVRDIILNLRNFSRLDESNTKEVDLHRGIESCLAILKSRLKTLEDRGEIEVVKKYGNLPQINCYASEMNQVFLSLLVNAIDALQEVRKMERQPRIEIQTETIENNWACITIADNGIGIPLELQSRIFDPFFTTKPVGSGTGLGLSVSYAIIEKHGGKLTCHSTLGEGTVLSILIPLAVKKGA